MVADVVRGDYLDPTLAKLTVSEFAKRWQATRGHLALATRDQDRHFLRSLILPTFGSHPVGSVRPSGVAAWLSQLEVASATKAKALQKLAAVLRMAVADGAIKTNPCDGIARPTQRSRRAGRALGRPRGCRSADRGGAGRRSDRGDGVADGPRRAADRRGAGVAPRRRGQWHVAHRRVDVPPRRCPASEGP